MMLLRLSAPATALLLALACSPGGSATPDPAPQAGAPSEQRDGANSGGAETDSTVTVQADAEVAATCRPQPRAGDDGDHELLADVEITNTGDLGVKVRIAAKWPQTSGQGLIRWKRVNVEQGDTRQLTLRLVVGETEAEAVRDAVELGRTCAIAHRVIGAYGD